MINGEFAVDVWTFGIITPLAGIVLIYGLTDWFDPIISKLQSNGDVK